MTDIFETFTTNLSEETGIDRDSAAKVITWLKSEGVLDFPVVSENYSEETENVAA